jgi:DNA-binding transcriptional regulator LsrR (DeoR family)
VEQIAGLEAQERQLRAAGAEKVFAEREIAMKLGISRASVFRVLKDA